MKDKDTSGELEQEIIDDITDEVSEEVIDELAQAKEQAKENFDKYIRQVAEFDNFRKRTIAEKAGMYNNGVKDVIEKLLPVIDNFERAISSFEEKESAMYIGIEMILKQFLEIMDSLGVTEIPAEGLEFDHNVHSAIMHIDDENFGKNIIVEVFQKGYKLDSKVIRHSMVKVAN